MEVALVVLVVALALGFDYTNGFHDAANAIATSVSTRALTPRVALLMAAVMNFVGALLGTEVAETIATSIVDLQDASNHTALTVVLCALVGAIVWNLITWWFGLPSSSTHSLIGGLVGAGLAAGLPIYGQAIIDKVVLPMVFSPLIGFIGAYFVMVAVLWIFRNAAPARVTRRFRLAQTASAAAMALGHGLQDAQKTMGVIFLALMSYGAVSTSATLPPLWVIVSCAIAMAAGTYTGGWRIIRTLGKGLVEIKPPQGMAAESAAAAVILLSSHFGYSLSTTQVATGSVLGSGVGKPGAQVRWGVAGRMVSAWLVTLPMAGGVGSGAYGLVHGIGGYPGIIVGVALLITATLAIWLRSRRARIDHHNVNAEWEGSLTGGLTDIDAHVPAPAQSPLVEQALRTAFEADPEIPQLTVITSDAPPAREVVRS